MKNRIAALLLLLTVLFCGLCGCTAPQDGKEGESTVENTGAQEQTTEKSTGGLLSSSAPVTPTTASGKLYLHASFQNQGEISGDYSLSGDKKDLVPLVDYNDSVTVPFDDKSGQPSGARQYGTVSFVHSVDKLTPFFRRAASQGETCTFTVDFYRQRADGMEEKYFTAQYEGALIVSAEIYTAERDSHYEEISFSFTSLTYTYVSGGKTFTEKWKAFS